MAGNTAGQSTAAATRVSDVLPGRRARERPRPCAGVAAGSRRGGPGAGGGGELLAGGRHVAPPTRALLRLPGVALRAEHVPGGPVGGGHQLLPPLLHLPVPRATRLVPQQGRLRGALRTHGAVLPRVQPQPHAARARPLLRRRARSPLQADRQSLEVVSDSGGRVATGGRHRSGAVRVEPLVAAAALRGAVRDAAVVHRRGGRHLARPRVRHGGRHPREDPPAGVAPAPTVAAPGSALGVRSGAAAAHLVLRRLLDPLPARAGRAAVPAQLRPAARAALPRHLLVRHPQLRLQLVHLLVEEQGGSRGCPRALHLQPPSRRFRGTLRHARHSHLIGNCGDVLVACHPPVTRPVTLTPSSYPVTLTLVQSPETQHWRLTQEQLKRHKG